MTGSSRNQFVEEGYILQSKFPRQQTDMDRSLCRRVVIWSLALVLPASSSCLGKTMMRAGGLSCHDKQTILDEHNRLRQLVALGQVPGQPGAANMMEMIWDDELATRAQKWADHCGEFHDESRHNRRFGVGQNIARLWTTEPPGPYETEPNWRQHISGWFKEVQHYRGGYSDATGHYTQLVWSDTYLVGCGYSFYYDPARGYTKNYVCNYGPSGNILGYQPYILGQPSCNRYRMSYSNKYAGLCSLGAFSPLGALCPYACNRPACFHALLD